VSCPRTIARFAAPGLLAALVAAPSAGTPVLERIAILLLNDDGLPPPDLSSDENLRERKSYFRDCFRTSTTM